MLLSLRPKWRSLKIGVNNLKIKLVNLYTKKTFVTSTEVEKSKNYIEKFEKS